MTIDRLHLTELIEKGSDVDLLREMMTFVINRMVDLDVESQTGAAYGERSTERTNQRNGYRERPCHTTIGTLPVAIPKLRKGSYFPSFLEALRTADKALIAVIQEAYVQGSRRARSTIWQRRWGSRAFRKVRSLVNAKKSTNGSRRSFHVLLRDVGPTCGSMRPT